MEPELKDEVAGSIPHMHLFMYLKRKFPALKDADITDVIQRFGLDKTRCEDELNRKNQEQHRGYNSPWNRSRTSSRDSPSSRNSPLSPSDTYSFTSSPLQNGSSPSTPISSQSQFCLNQRFNVSDKENSDFPLSNSHSQSGETKSKYSYACSTKDSSSSPEASHWKHSSPQAADSGCGRSSNECKYLEEETSATQTVSEPRTPFLGQKSPEPQVLDERSAHLYHISPPHNMNPPTNSSSIVTTNANPVTLPVNSQNAQNSQVPAAIQEQLARKQRLKEELNQRMGEKMKMEIEVKSLVEELETRETTQRLEVIRSKNEIEQIQRENSKLQSVCDEMERKILESGESPKTDQEGKPRGSPLRLPLSPNEYPCPPVSTLETPHRPPQQPLPRENSTSSLNSGGVITPTTPILPTRKAPSPPPISRSPPTSAGRNFEQATQRPATIGSDESRKEWACSKCTFLNSPYLNECEICSFPHFSLGTPPQLTSQSHPPHPGGPCYCHQRRHYNNNQENRNAGEWLLLSVWVIVFNIIMFLFAIRIPLNN